MNPYLLAFRALAGPPPPADALCAICAKQPATVTTTEQHVLDGPYRVCDPCAENVPTVLIHQGPEPTITSRREPA